jgi:hypothetical protein
MVTQLINEKVGWNGRMISASKSGYRERHPNNLAVFNSNICTKSEGKVWYGDIDLTESKDKLLEVAAEAGEDIYVLYEMDARFENEGAPIFNRAVAVFSPDGSVKLADNLADRFTL